MSRIEVSHSLTAKRRENISFNSNVGNLEAKATHGTKHGSLILQPVGLVNLLINIEANVVNDVVK